MCAAITTYRHRLARHVAGIRRTHQGLQIHREGLIVNLGKLWRYTAAAGVLLATVGVAVGTGSTPAHAIAEINFVVIPPGYTDSDADMTDTGQGAREIFVNNHSPDLVTVDTWANGNVYVHVVVPPGPGQAIRYGVFLDGTVTRWKTCTYLGSSTCQIAGSYKFGALNTDNGAVPDSAFFIIPPPEFPSPH
jgi:hypothetical protein